MLVVDGSCILWLPPGDARIVTTIIIMMMMMMMIIIIIRSTTTVTILATAISIRTTSGSTTTATLMMGEMQRNEPLGTLSTGPYLSNHVVSVVVYPTTKKKTPFYHHCSKDKTLAIYMRFSLPSSVICNIERYISYIFASKRSMCVRVVV